MYGNLNHPNEMKISLLIFSILIVAVIIFSVGCLKKLEMDFSDRDAGKEQVSSVGKFSYIFERKGRRNPYIGEGIFTPPVTVPKTSPDTKREVEKPVESKQPIVKTNETTTPIKKWPPDKELAKLLKETYKNMDVTAARIYEEIVDTLENIDDVSDEDFVNLFTNIYLLYKFYYQSKRGKILKKYTKELKTYIDEIESIFNPVK